MLQMNQLMISLLLIIVAHVLAMHVHGARVYSDVDGSASFGDVSISNNVKIYYTTGSSPSTWIDVCYDGFTTEAAITICKQLGFVNYYDKKYSHNHITSSSPAIQSVICPTKSNYLLFGASHILRCVIGPVLNNSCSLVAMECEGIHVKYTSYDFIHI
jgi:hypothetical protein